MTIDLLAGTKTLNVPIDLLEGIPVEQDEQRDVLSWRKAPAPTMWERIKSVFPEDTEAEAARVKNALVYSEMLGIRPSVAYDYHDEISQQVQDKLSTEKIITEKKGLGTAYESGRDTSIYGLMKNQKVPAPFESVSQLERWIHGATAMGYDLPVFLTGMALGGGPTTVSGWGGAFALPQGLRQVLIDKYSKGDVRDFRDFMDRTGNAVKETIKGEIVGGLTGMSGMALPTSKIGYKAMVELATMTAAGKLIEGEIPTARDFVDNAAILLMMHAGIKGYEIGSQRIPEIKTHLQDTYRSLGTHPKAITESIINKPIEEIQADLTEILTKVNEETKTTLPTEEKIVQPGATSGGKQPGIDIISGTDSPDILPGGWVRSGDRYLPRTSLTREDIAKILTERDSHPAMKASEIKEADNLLKTGKPRIDSDLFLHPEEVSKAWDRVSKEFPDVEGSIRALTEAVEQEGKLADTGSGFEIRIGSGFAKNYSKEGGLPRFYETAIRHELLHARAVKLGYERYGEGTPAKLHEAIDNLAQGKPVPPEVLKDYPDLKAPTSGGKIPEPQPTGQTSIANKEVEAERVARGLEPLESTQGMTSKQIYELAKEKTDRGEINPEELTQKINNAVEIGERPVALTDLENGAMTYQIAKYKNEHAFLEKEIEIATSEGRDTTELVNRRNDIEVLRDETEKALRATGTEQSSALRTRGIIINEDYSYSGMIQRAKEEGIPITEERRNIYKELSAKIEKLEAELRKREQTVELENLDKTIKIIKNEEGLKKRKEKRTYKKEELDAEFDSLINGFAKASGSQFGSILGGIELENTKILVSLARNRIQKGIVTAEGIVDEIYTALKNAGIEYSKRDIRDAISQYGVTKEMSKEAIDVALREAKTQMRLISALEDATEGITPLRTGLQRDKMSERVKELTREVKQAMRDNGINLKEGKSPEEQWITAMQTFKTRTENQIREYERRLAEGDFAPKIKKEPMTLGESELALKYKLDELKKEYVRQNVEYKLSQRGTFEKITSGIAESMNLIRAIKSSYDVSAAGRQGFFAFISHPVQGFRNMPEMFRALKSDEAAFRIESEIQKRPNYKLYQKADVSLTEKSGKGYKVEEIYNSRWAEMVPGIPASERAFVSFLNLTRCDLFDALHESAFGKKGKTATTEELKALGNYVNQATGRGTIKGYEGALQGLGTFLWAPKLVLSRFQMLAGQGMWKGTAATRTAIAKEYARILTGLGIVYAVSSILGAGLEDDPRSSDFGKIVVGNTRIDVLAGVSQATVFISRIATGETKNLRTGKITPLTGDYVPYGGTTVAGVIGNFLRSKLTPVLGEVITFRQGKDLVGDKVTMYDIPEHLLLPLAVSDIYQAMAEEGVPMGAALGTLGMFGVGIQTHEQKGAKP